MQPEPNALRHAEVARQAQVGVGGHTSLAEHDLVDAPRWNPDVPRELVLAKPHRLQEVLEQDLARVWVRKSLWQGGFNGSRRSQHPRHRRLSTRNKFATDRRSGCCTDLRDPPTEPPGGFRVGPPGRRVGGLGPGSAACAGPRLGPRTATGANARPAISTRSRRLGTT